MATASILIRDLPHYRREAFTTGLQRHGYEISYKASPSPNKDDLLVIWNRYGDGERAANNYERRGARVIVAENGWIGHDDKGHQHYAICLDHHNGAGRWFVGDTDRFSKIHVELKPWRERGDHLLMLPQRGIGPEGVAMPATWLTATYANLKTRTQRELVNHQHPGAERPSLEPFFENCHAAITWASGAGIKAIAAGIPVFHGMEKWIGAPAARRLHEDLEQPYTDARMPMFHRLSWAMWSVDEIARGEPFEHLLRL